MSSRGILRTLAPELRAELDRRLVERNFSGYTELSAWLRTQGCIISRQSVQKYGNQLEGKMAALERATAQARALLEAAPDDDCQITEAMLRLVQQQLFAVLIELTPAKAKQINLGALATSVAQMSRATIMHRKSVEEWRVLLKARAVKAEAKLVEAVAKDGGGLTPETTEAIRNALLEVTK